MSSDDPFGLERFVSAQASIFDTALGELRDGRKRSHWMWFVFPQMQGLGRSSTAAFYGITGLEEASAYLRHPVLGPRLIRAVQTVLLHSGRSAHEIFGSPDDLKFRSSMTLFALVDQARGPFRSALDVFFEGKQDEATCELAGR